MPGLAPSRPSRRDLLRFAAAAGLTAPLAGAARAQPLRTRARIVIAGAGAAGLTMASKLSRMLDGARITLIGARAAHWYQPGFTMVASGVWPVGKVVSETAAFVAPGVTWVRADVAAFEPEAKRVVATDGSTHDYDALVAARGSPRSMPGRRARRRPGACCSASWKRAASRCTAAPPPR